MKKIVAIVLLLGGIFLISNDFISYYESCKANERMLNVYQQTKSTYKPHISIELSQELISNLEITSNDSSAMKQLEEDSMPISKISIPSLEIEYPIMKGKDNAYYLNHDSEGQKNKYGSIFWDYKGRPLIFGHNAMNGAMFGKLKQIKTGELVYIDELAYEVSCVDLVEVEKVMAIEHLSLITCHGDPSIRLVVSLTRSTK